MSPRAEPQAGDGAVRGRSPRARQVVVGLLLGVLAFLTIPVPHFEAPVSTVLSDRDGRLLGAAIATDEQWRFPSTGRVPARFAAAIQRYEDRRFRWHLGVDPVAVGRALRDNLAAGEVVSGASTLTMQVVRLSRDNPPRTLPEKVIEAVLATRMELSLSKDEILALYAAHAPFGGNTVGLEAAAWRYFGRAPHDLSWAEAATLAVLPNSPGLIHPGRNRTRLRIKRDRLLDAMQAGGILSEADADLAKGEPIPDTPVPVPRLAPHLATRALSEARAAGSDASRFPTTIDRRLQEQATEVVWTHHRRLAENRVHNAAVIVMDVPTGEVLAYVGNVPELDRAAHHNHVDIITAQRSTGSLLKPFLYAAMLESGELLPHQLVPDVPARFGGFAPENFDRRYTGALPAARALARSRNVPAVWMLRLFGVDRFYGFLSRAGMGTLHRPATDYGLALILGGAEGTLEELTELYRGLAWSALRADDPTARRPAPRWSRAPRWQPATPPRPPLRVAPDAAWLTLEALLEVQRPGVHGAWRALQGSRRVAWKTGTSFGHRDGWAIGVTPDHAVGVWVGNADGEGRPGLTGFQAAAPLLFDVFDLLERGPWFDPPDDLLVDIQVCADSGMRLGRDCPRSRTAAVPQAGLRGRSCSHCTQIHCDAGCVHRVHAGCEDDLQSTPWFTLAPSMAWYYARQHPSYRPVPDWRPDCVDAVEAAPPMSCLYPPQDGSEIYVPVELDGERGRAVFQAAHRDPEAHIHWHLDDTFIETTQTIHEVALAPGPGPHRLTLVDQDGARLVRRFTVLDKEASTP